MYRWCDKDRKLWYDQPLHILLCSLLAHHPCTQPCHAPLACPEAELCKALASISCPSSCGRIKQSLRCRLKSCLISRTLKCHNQSEIEITKQNARLAEALGVSNESRERVGRHMTSGPVVYPDGVMGFAKEDLKFMLLVEKICCLLSQRCTGFLGPPVRRNLATSLHSYTEPPQMDRLIPLR